MNMKRNLNLYIFFTFTTLNGVMAKVALKGIGTSFPNEVYKLWQPSFTVYRQNYVDLDLIYNAVDSTEAKQVLYNNVDVEYASVEGIISEQEQREHPDLVEFPVMGG